MQTLLRVGVLSVLFTAFHQQLEQCSYIQQQFPGMKFKGYFIKNKEAILK